MKSKTSDKSLKIKDVKQWLGADCRDMTDEQLIVMMHEVPARYPEIVNFLIAKYSDYVRYLYAAMNIYSPDRDDIIQEGIIGIYDAIEKYDPSKGALFKTYATLEIRGNILNAVSRLNKLGNLPLKDYVPTEQIFFNIPSSDLTPEEEALHDELIDRVYFLMEKELSETERRCLILRISGYSHKEIARIMNISEKSTENAITRARNKIRDAIRKDAS